MQRDPIEILSPTEAATEAAVSRDTIRSWARRGHIECLRTRTGRIVIVAESFRRFLVQRTAKGGTR